MGTAVGVGMLYVTDFDLMHPNFLSLTAAVVIPPCFSVLGYNLCQKDNVEQSNLLLYKEYIAAKSYSIEDIAIKRSPKVSIKIIEIKF